MNKMLKHSNNNNNSDTLNVNWCKDVIYDYTISS